MLGQIEEVAAQLDVEALVAQFKQKVVNLSQQLDENDPQQKRLERVMAVADQIDPLILVNMMKEIDECGTLITIPKEAIAEEAGKVPPPAEQPAQAAVELMQPGIHQEAAGDAAQANQENNTSGNPAVVQPNAAVAPKTFKLDFDVTDDSDSDTDLEDDEYIWTAYLLD